MKRNGNRSGNLGWLLVYPKSQNRDNYPTLPKVEGKFSNIGSPKNGICCHPPFPFLKPDDFKPCLWATTTVNHSVVEFGGGLKNEDLARQAAEEDWAVVQRHSLFVRENIKIPDGSKIDRKGFFWAHQKKGNFRAIHAMFVGF